MGSGGKRKNCTLVLPLILKLFQLVIRAEEVHPNLLLGLNSFLLLPSAGNSLLILLILSSLYMNLVKLLLSNCLPLLKHCTMCL